MRDLASDAHFFVETLSVPVLRKKLQGYGLPDPQVVGPIDLAHPPSSDQRDDAVSATENLPRCELPETGNVSAHHGRGLFRRTVRGRLVGGW